MIATAVENTKTAWLGDFPSHWQVLRIKNLFQEMDSRSETGNEELLSVSHYTGVTLKRESLENEDDHLTNAESLVGYKLVQQGDLVINIMLAWNGSLGISPYNGITSPAYCVYRIKGDNNPEYFGYLFTTNLFKAEFRRNSTGIIDSRLRLYSDKLFSIYSVVPPKNEQDEIVQYIKAQEEKINLFIQKKQRFIELLKEQRQSIILNTTRAIDKHDKTIRVKYLGRIRSGDGISNENLKDEGGYEVFGGNGFIGYTNTFNVEGENIIIGRVGAKCGNIRLINEKKFISDNALVLTLFEKNNYEYVAMVLEALDLNKLSVSTAQPLITGTKVMNIAIPHLSSEEQKQIVSHIKTETATIDTAIAKAEREIELIREYKESMVSEAVMGNRK